MESERYFAGDITVVLADGSRVPAKLTADEVYAEGKEIYRISLEQGTEARTIESGVDFFEALKQLRQELEKTGALLYCFGASEDVYPSGMQRSMGPAVLAYKMRIGFPTSRQDIVSIFEADERLFQLQSSNRSAFIADGSIACLTRRRSNESRARWSSGTMM